MRVAALYDVHGNLPALEAVLREVERERADVIVSGGDLLSGPFGSECLERLAGLGEAVRFVRGNADREVGEHAAVVDGWPLTVSLEVPELGTVLFCHATPQSDEPIITRVTPDEIVADAFEDAAENVVVCGHTHVQFDRTAGRTRIINAGSVGMPYEGRTGAFWALLGPDVELRRTDYDVDEAAARIARSGYPDAEEWAREYVLEPYSADFATEELERQRLAAARGA